MADITDWLLQCEREHAENASGKNDPDSVYGVAVAEIRKLRLEVRFMEIKIMNARADLRRALGALMAHAFGAFRI